MKRSTSKSRLRALCNQASWWRQRRQWRPIEMLDSALQVAMVAPGKLCHPICCRHFKLWSSQPPGVPPFAAQSARLAQQFLFLLLVCLFWHMCCDHLGKSLTKFVLKGRALVSFPINFFPKNKAFSNQIHIPTCHPSLETHLSEFIPEIV